jgi:hypothetical protein
VLRRQLFAFERADGEVVAGDHRALLADCLALARVQRGQEIVERAVVLVSPVVLDAQAGEKSDLFQHIALAPRSECDVQRGHAGILDRGDER